jgi:hypothetical protein
MSGTLNHRASGSSGPASRRPKDKRECPVGPRNNHKWDRPRDLPRFRCLLTLPEFRWPHQISLIERLESGWFGKGAAEIVPGFGANRPSATDLTLASVEPIRSKNWFVTIVPNNG